MIITKYINTRRNKGKIFKCELEHNERVKPDTYYQGLFNGYNKYFVVLNPNSRLYRDIVGCICEDTPILVKSTGYGSDLTNENIAHFIINTKLYLITDAKLLNEIHKRETYC